MVMLCTKYPCKSQEIAAPQAYLVQVTCTRDFHHHSALAFEDGIMSVGKLVGACEKIAYFGAALTPRCKTASYIRNCALCLVIQTNDQSKV